MRFKTWAATIAIIVLPLQGALLATNWRSHSCPYGQAIRIPLPFDHISERAWYAEIPALERLADDSLDAYKSPLVMCENDRVLGPGHSYHHDIARGGRGRFSHWGTGLVFSTSDGSNPNTNGRSYLAIRIKSSLPEVAGEIVKLDKENQQISLQSEQPGQTGGAIEQFLLNTEPAYDLLKVGDRVALTIDYQDGVWKVTRYSRTAERSAAPPLSQEVTGQIVKLDKANQQISLQHEEPGQTSGAIEQFLLSDEPAYDLLNVGDQVALTIEAQDGVRKVTRYSRTAERSAAPPPSQEVTGQIVKLDKANQQISLQRDEPGQTGGAIEQFLLNHEPAYDLLKVGDQVVLTIEYQDGVRKVTRYSQRSAAVPPSQEVTGQIVKLDKDNQQISLQREEHAQTGGAIEQFLLNHEPAYDSLKVGDQVVLTIEYQDGVRKVTRYSQRSAAVPPAQEVTGQIVKLDKDNQQISLQREEPGQAGGAIEQFLLNHEPAYDLLKVGDQITLTIEYQDGVRKVTRYSRSAERSPR